jgi:hypothetical protein
MGVCATCRVRHAPYTCAQYQALRQAENAADDERAAARRESAAQREEAGSRRWWRLSRKRTRPT